jgi:hypothetical protein
MRANQKRWAVAYRSGAVIVASNRVLGRRNVNQAIAVGRGAAQGGEVGPRVTMDATSETMNNTRKMKNTNLAISAAATEMPVKPTNPAISEIMKKTAAQ